MVPNSDMPIRHSWTENSTCWAHPSTQAGKQCAERRHRGMHPSRKPGLLAKRLEWREMIGARPSAVQKAQPTRIPQGEVRRLILCMRSPEAERCDGGHDQAGIHGCQTVVVQTKGRHMLGMDIVDKQVRVFNETLKGLLALGLFQVECDPAFIGVQEKIESALFRVWLPAWKRTALTGRVSPVR